MNVRSRALVLLSLTALLFVHPARSQEKPGSKKSKASKPEAKLRGRLPNNFSRLGIDEEQRSTIYRVQERYRPEIAGLLKKMAELRAQRDREIETVLTGAQKSRLKELRADAKRRRAKKSAKQKKSGKSK